VVLSHGDSKIVSDAKNGLYVLNPVNKVNVSTYTVITNPTSDTWHRRFGHANLPGIYKLYQNQLVTGLKLPKEKDLHQLCDACELGRKRRSTFVKYERKNVRECNSGVHSDICGPSSPNGLNGEAYVLIFIDVYSRYVQCHLLNVRSEFFSNFLNYKASHFVTFLPSVTTETSAAVCT
jgi:hypothetical protein